MTTDGEPWPDMVAQLRAALSDGDVDGAVLEAETVADVGAVSLDTVIEAASGDTDTQIVGYRTLCDLLSTRLGQGAGQVLGCLLINGEPDPEAFATGLDGMIRDDGTFTPVLPLSVDQAQSIVQARVALFDVVDPATTLIEIAASRAPVSTDGAETALEEIDELIARRAG